MKHCDCLVSSAGLYGRCFANRMTRVRRKKVLGVWGLVNHEAK